MKPCKPQGPWEPEGIKVSLHHEPTPELAVTVTATTGGPILALDLGKDKNAACAGASPWP
jgi:hypothetical protein